MVDRDRGDRRPDRGELAERYLDAAGRGRIDPAECIGPELEVGLDFEDHKILVEPRIDSRRDPLAKRVVQDRVDDGRVDAKLQSELAVDVDLHNPAAALLVAGDIGKLRQSLELL